MNVVYPLKNRLTFYWTYFYAKTVLLWFEVKKPKFAMFAHELRYSLSKFRKRTSMATSPFGIDYVETVYGKFHIRPHSSDMSIVSPAYERFDTRYLAHLLERLALQGKKILVLDIGAHVGAFSVMVGNRFRGYDDIRIKAFEPDGACYLLLEKNIVCNRLTGKVETFNVFLSSKAGEKPPRICKEAGKDKNRFGRLSGGWNCDKVTHTLDSFLAGQMQDFNSIVMKIDTEGEEINIMRGGRGLLESGAEIHLLVEDFIDQEIVTFLDDIGAEFVTKLTPYNSWWKGRGLNIGEYAGKSDR